MNIAIELKDLKNRFYTYYYENGKPKLLKSNSELKLMQSLDRLENQEVSSYLVVDLLEFATISHNYKKTDNINNIYSLIVRTKDRFYFFTVGPRPFYDEAVYLSMGDYIKINRKESTYYQSKKNT
jgi:hypothetical protein